jgi:ribosome biogenesis SPOUT family RNA methylase Rps3
MKKQPILVIEHCEPELSEWLKLEYRHAIKLWDGKTLFTRVNDKKTVNFLKKISKIEKKKAKEVFHDKKCVVLDPQAKKPLTLRDFSRTDAIVVGGILGYEKPKGRTKKLISKESNFETRHLGKTQLTIDGAVFVAKAISLGLRFSDIEIAREIEIIHNPIHSTILPFGYPIVNNKPVITPGLVEYITRN